MKTSRVLRIVLLSIVLGCVGPAFSQSSTGSISGTVTDQNNAVVLGAAVFGKNTETGFVRSAVTNSSGLYRLTDIPSGPYEITIEAAGGGAKLFRGLSPGQRVGNAGRSILRSDGINLVDFGIIKNTRLSENVRVQLRADMFNSFNSRNFGIPNGAINSGANFLNQWATNGGNRRIVLGARLAF